MDAAGRVGHRLDGAARAALEVSAFSLLPMVSSIYFWLRTWRSLALRASRLDLGLHSHCRWARGVALSLVADSALSCCLRSFRSTFAPLYSAMSKMAPSYATVSQLLPSLNRPVDVVISLP